jgi:hypothetical protein
MEWKEAIIQVLKNEPGPVHYTDIAEMIASQRLRNRGELGATPATTVNVVIGNSLRDEGEASPFVRIERGMYAFRDSNVVTAKAVAQAIDEDESSTEAGLINAFGMYWERSKVLWEQQTRIYGKQQETSQPVDFSEQAGVYLLHDMQGVVYVGRITEQNLGRRLYQHTTDRLSGRWNQFSWFGIYAVQGDGSLGKSIKFSSVSVEVVIATMEALLIEGLEPRQNRRRGDGFQAIEFLQSDDPQLERKRKISVVQEMMEQLKSG